MMMRWWVLESVCCSCRVLHCEQFLYDCVFFVVVVVCDRLERCGVYFVVDDEPFVDVDFDYLVDYEELVGWVVVDCL